MDMSLEEKTKKIRISKFAAEYNLSSDAIVEHLTKKGFKVNSINTMLTDEMLAELNFAFKKEIDKALTQKRKIEELNKLRESESPKEFEQIKSLKDEIAEQAAKRAIEEKDESKEIDLKEIKEVVDRVEIKEDKTIFSKAEQTEIKEIKQTEQISQEVATEKDLDLKKIEEFEPIKPVEEKREQVERKEIQEVKENKEPSAEEIDYEKDKKRFESEIQEIKIEEAKIERKIDELSEEKKYEEEKSRIDKKEIIDEEKIEKISEQDKKAEKKPVSIIAPFDDLVEEAENLLQKEKEAAKLDESKEEVYRTETELELINKRPKVLGKIELPQDNRDGKKGDFKDYRRDKRKPEDRKFEKEKFDREKRDKDKEPQKFEKKLFQKSPKSGEVDDKNKERDKKLGDKKKFFKDKKFEGKKQQEPIRYNRDRKNDIDPEIAVLSEYYEDDTDNLIPQPLEEAVIKTNEMETEEEKKEKKKKKKEKNKQSDVKSEFEKKKKRGKKIEIDKTAVKEAIKRTLLSMDESTLTERAFLRKKKKKEKAAELEKQIEEQERESKILKVTEFVSVMELANLMKVDVSQVIQKCISLGLMVSINQRLDVETITLVADEFGFEVEFQEEFISEEIIDEPDPPEKLKPRPPVVTVMGHVDHGKTSLLDRIRQTNVVAGEAGGITQHIGAYQVKLPNGKSITFLDTPGHEAFTAMRARGAKVTDIVVLVVAADDAVMPQTVEAINHAQAAGAPIVVAINKIDKPGANIDKIKQQLAERNILVEDWGGKYQYAEISAKLGKNIEVLLDKILLEAELMDLKANPDRPARGVVIEAKMDKGKGIMATILVQKGTLRIGDSFVCGIAYGRVRAMYDERDNRVEEAGPSTPVVVTGFEEMPQAGDTFLVVDSERKAREIALKRQQIKRQQDAKQVRHITLDEIAKRVAIGGVKELPLIIKGDVDGSVQALSDSLLKLSNEEVKVNIIHKGVGAISESDVLLASASGAIIIGFNVRPNMNARKLAETDKIDIRLYNIIYDVINEIKSALEGMLSPVISEEIIGSAEVREIFKVPKVGTVAGCYVTEGKIARSAKVRVIRDGIVIYDGEIASLKRFKDDAREVEQGYECGIGIQGFNDIKVGDIIEAYKLIETKKKL